LAFTGRSPQSSGVRSPCSPELWPPACAAGNSRTHSRARLRPLFSGSGNWSPDQAKLAERHVFIATKPLLILSKPRKGRQRFGGCEHVAPPGLRSISMAGRATNMSLRSSSRILAWDLGFRIWFSRFTLGVSWEQKLHGAVCSVAVERALPSWAWGVSWDVAIEIQEVAGGGMHSFVQRTRGET